MNSVGTRPSWPEDSFRPLIDRYPARDKDYFVATDEGDNVAVWKDAKRPRTINLRLVIEALRNQMGEPLLLMGRHSRLCQKVASALCSSVTESRSVRCITYPERE